MKKNMQIELKKKHLKTCKIDLIIKTPKNQMNKYSNIYLFANKNVKFQNIRIKKRKSNEIKINLEVLQT